MTSRSSPESSKLSPLRLALKRSTAALKADGVPFVLGGGYALWVHGAPEPEHDVDLVVAEQDLEAACHSLTAAGFRVDQPPEDWLVKAYLDDTLVDVLHRLNGTPVDEQLIGAADEFEVLGVRIPVLPATEVVRTKLLSLSEHYCDFAALLPVVRAVREQVDWSHIQASVRDHPFAESFLLLVDRLAIVKLDPYEEA